LTIAHWLRLVLQGFYAPSRSLREVRDRATLGPAALVALFASAIFFLCLTVFFLRSLVPTSPAVLAISSVIQSGSFLVLIAVFFAPVVLLFTNLIDRRASIRLLFQQEYVPLTSTLFFGLAVSSLIAAVVSVVGKYSGFQERMGGRLLGFLLAKRSEFPPDMLPSFDQALAPLNPAIIAGSLSLIFLFVIFCIWAVLSVRVVFRLSWLMSVAVVMVSGIPFVLGIKLLPIFAAVLASPFLLLMLFLLLRGFISDVTRTQRAREAFKQNLEAATLNPADASAHYNLGLIHQQRGELDAARERFERAVQIDAEEIDAHYQLGRIARQQKRLTDAIRHFEQVVSRNTSHAQHEIWREVGATYVAANQFGDAIDALRNFLEQRPSDPEALYLMGRAHAGLGHRNEAANSMRACIEAVKTAPAYKYRADKRWLNEAQQFLRSQV
jgi:tetratricopeptide (TPR) repeat protein